MNTEQQVGGRTEKVFPCTEEGMLASQAFLETVCAAPKPAIILDEIVSNIVRCSGASTFGISLEQTADGLLMVFTDGGKPFDPTREIEEPDVAASIEAREIGGLGIFMVKKMAKSVAYRRDADRNVLTILI